MSSTPPIPDDGIPTLADSSALVPGGDSWARGDRTEPEPWEGQLIDGRYAVERVIGVGGMGVVLAARHRVLGHLCAIKVMHPELAFQPDLVARFIQEGRAVVRLRSEHVARVTDVGLHSGAPFLVMELLDGMDLGSWLQSYGALPLDTAIDWFTQAAEAIAEAHSAGILHRDIKPPNLFVAHRDEAPPVIKVLDFGIARVAGAGGSLHPATRAGMVMGSPGYMSPEQVEAASDVDERTDVWALGCVLFEMVTGQPAWRGDSEAAVMAAVLRDPAPRLTGFHLPETLDRVVQRCLTRDRVQRHACVADLVQDLLPLATEEVAARIARIRSMTSPSRSPRFERTVLGWPEGRASALPTPISSKLPDKATCVGVAAERSTSIVPRPRALRASVFALGTVLIVGMALWGLIGLGPASSESVGIAAGAASPALLPSAPVSSRASMVEPVDSAPIPPSRASASSAPGSARPATSRAVASPKRQEPKAKPPQPPRTSSIPNYGGRE